MTRVSNSGGSEERDAVGVVLRSCENEAPWSARGVPVGYERFKDKGLDRIMTQNTWRLGVDWVRSIPPALSDAWLGCVWRV